MHIGIDVRSMFGTPAGVGRYLANLLRHLSGLDQENIYWLYTDHQIDTPIVPNPHFHQKHLTLPFAQNYFTWNHLRLPPELFQHPVDVFHFPFYTMPVVRNYKSVVTIHDITYEIHPEWYAWKGLLAMRPFSRYAAKHADRILTDSQHSKNDLMKYYGIPEDKIVVTYLGVEDSFRPLEDPHVLEETKTKYHLTSPQMILYVGSIHIRRNVKQLIRAFAKVCQKHSEVQLVLVGKQEYPYLDLQALITELALHQRVILPGYLLYDSDLLALYNLADVFIYPSSYEGFGLPPLEAMACGTPVITANNSSLPEVTGDAAILLNDPLDIDEIAEAISQVLNNEHLRNEMITKGLLQACKFTWEQVAAKTLTAYREVLEMNG